MTDQLSGDSSQNLEERRVIGGREFHIQIELEWMPMSEAVDLGRVPPGIDSNSFDVGRTRAIRRTIDGSPVDEAQWHEGLAEAIRFERLVNS